jgi:hypothetical protein
LHRPHALAVFENQLFIADQKGIKVFGNPAIAVAGRTGAFGTGLVPEMPLVWINFPLHSSGREARQAHDYAGMLGTRQQGAET